MMRRDFFLTNRALRDLNPLTAGEQRCNPGHSFGPAVRNYTLIHYVISGKGVLYARSGVHPVKAGQAFLILPGEVTTYAADHLDPWHYRWVGFDGVLSADFAKLPPVFELAEELFRRILQAAEEASVAEYRISGELFRLYAALFVKVKRENPHVRRVENFIRASYMQHVRVEELAAQMNLDRRYLSRLFKEKTGFSIQEYLIFVRMEQAEQHLRLGRSVKETAMLVGYDDVSNFSKMFKKCYGIPPVEVLRK